MPIIFKDEYGRRQLEEGKYAVIVPTIQRFVEADGTDVRLDRVRIFDKNGAQLGSYLRDKMGNRFEDNLSNTEDDLSYIESLPSRESIK